MRCICAARTRAAVSDDKNADDECDNISTSLRLKAPAVGNTNHILHGRVHAVLLDCMLAGCCDHDNT